MLGGYVVEHSMVIAGVFEFFQALLIVHDRKAGHTIACIILMGISLDATSRPLRHERLGGHLRPGGCHDLRPV